MPSTDDHFSNGRRNRDDSADSPSARARRVAAAADRPCIGRRTARLLLDEGSAEGVRSLKGTGCRRLSWSGWGGPFDGSDDFRLAREASAGYSARRTRVVRALDHASFGEAQLKELEFLGDRSRPPCGLAGRLFPPEPEGLLRSASMKCSCPRDLRRVGTRAVGIAAPDCVRQAAREDGASDSDNVLGASFEAPDRRRLSRLRRGLGEGFCCHRGLRGSASADKAPRSQVGA